MDGVNEELRPINWDILFGHVEPELKYVWVRNSHVCYGRAWSVDRYGNKTALYPWTAISAMVWPEQFTLWQRIKRWFS